MAGPVSDLRVLTTSRSPIGFEGERVLWVDPMETTDRESPAAQLFRARAAQAGTEIPEDSETSHRLAGMLGNLGGLPLAIELAAAQLRHLSFDDLVEVARERPEMLQRRGEAGGTYRSVEHPSTGAGTSPPLQQATWPSSPSSRVPSASSRSRGS